MVRKVAGHSPWALAWRAEECDAVPGHGRAVQLLVIGLLAQPPPPPEPQPYAQRQA